MDDPMQEAPVDMRKDIIKMLAECIGYAAPQAEQSSSEAAAAPEGYACGQVECASLAQQLLNLILELLGRDFRGCTTRI